MTKSDPNLPLTYFSENLIDLTSSSDDFWADLNIDPFGEDIKISSFLLRMHSKSEKTELRKWIDAIEDILTNTSLDFAPSLKKVKELFHFQKVVFKDLKDAKSSLQFFKTICAKLELDASAESTDKFLKSVCKEEVELSFKVHIDERVLRSLSRILNKLKDSLSFTLDNEGGGVRVSFPTGLAPFLCALFPSWKERCREACQDTLASKRNKFDADTFEIPFFERKTFVLHITGDVRTQIPKVLERMVMKLIKLSGGEEGGESEEEEMSDEILKVTKELTGMPEDVLRSLLKREDGILNSGV